MRAIAKDAGVTAGQITVNFGSKENLFNEIVMDMCRMTEKRLRPHHRPVQLSEAERHPDGGRRLAFD